jgi:hypothetical protein
MDHQPIDGVPARRNGSKPVSRPRPLEDCIEYDTNGGCWLWSRSVSGSEGHKYGSIYRLGRIEKAHRVAYIAAFGPIPTGMIVRHKCDVPSCVNPTHLELGTTADNARDRDSRGRANTPRGELHGRAKLTNELVASIRVAVSQGAKKRAIARHLGVSSLCVDNAMLGWRHVMPNEASADIVARLLALPNARRKPRGSYHIRSGK